MKEKFKKIIVKILCMLVITATCFCTISIIEQRTSFADSGHSTSHHSRSSSGSRSRSSSSSSSRSRSRSSSSSSSSRRSSNSSGSSSSMSPKAAMIMLMCFIGIPLFWIIMVSIVSSSSRKKYKVNVTKKEIIRPNVANKIKMIKPDFKEDEFLKEGFNIYKDVQVAWMNFDLKSVRNIITDELFNMYQSQLDVMEASNEQNIMKDMIMRDGYIIDAIVQNGELTIVTQYVIDQYDYVADRTTGKLIRGESKYKMRVEYQMRFRLSVDKDKHITNCPNCGAKLNNFNGAGTCEYCGSKVVSDHSKWVLTEKKVINQDYL